jgi:RimJ/RimL family protein N-acetyltransferase/mannose-6-phosphate isomerase-like protein (cupin superfamily)
MLIPRDKAKSSEIDALTMRHYHQAAAGGVSVTVVEVPPKGQHRYRVSSRCDALYYMIDGFLRFDVDGRAYTAKAGDLIVVPKDKLFQYFDWQGNASRMLVVHVPAFDPAAEYVLPNELRTHDVHLSGRRVTLRPMTEDDWEHMVAWQTDPEVLVWSDGTEEPRSPEDAKSIYREVSIWAYVFIIELGGEPIGDCWLQQLNVVEVLERFPGRDLRRIDIVIGKKDLWGKGFGTDTLRALVRFAFEQEQADGIYAPVSPDNARSRGAFRKAGFRDLDNDEGLIIWRDDWQANSSSQA